MKIDYLIVGSGLSALVFAALMAKSGQKVLVLEAHEYPGGFGHTFEIAGKYKFNAQLHYVWDCGEGQAVYKILQKLNLEQIVSFARYDSNGFDHMRMPGYSLDIPSDNQELINRLVKLFPDREEQIRRFILEVQTVRSGLRLLTPPRSLGKVIYNLNQTICALKYLNSTLQDVFDKFQIPPAAQTLLALQWPDFLLPPNQLSFYAWVILFTSYQAGAFYPTRHFEHVINSLVETIRNNQGELLFNYEVKEFVLENKTIKGVKAINLTSKEMREFTANNTICNLDPQKAAQMIGMDNFEGRVRRKLNYDYSPSNFVAYCVVKGIDLRDYGFGAWNTFHTEQSDLNEAFKQMYERHDYSQLSFAITTPTLLTNQERDCPEDCQIIEFLTVADYDYFRHLRSREQKAYRDKKNEIFEKILDVMEKKYIPEFRKYIVLSMTGSPTTNERFCWCPRGNSYGSNLTPRNMGMGRLNHETSLNHFYFCNASSGYPGFAPTFWTGAMLYQRLTNDWFLADSRVIKK